MAATARQCTPDIVNHNKNYSPQELTLDCRCAGSAAVWTSRLAETHNSRAAQQQPGSARPPDSRRGESEQKSASKS